MANRFTNALAKIPFLQKNFNLIPTGMGGINEAPRNIPMVQNNAHNPRNYTIPLQMQRIRQDVQSWRQAITEAENAYYPHRYRMQQLFVDKVLEGHILACIEKRKNLTLLKDFVIADESGKTDENLTQIFKDKAWFKTILSYILDAQFYGYSLIQLGELEAKGKEYNFKNSTILKRWHVSPDRLQYVQIPYQTWGLDFMDESEKDDNGESFADWMLYVPTPSDTGASICGYGLLYNVALYGIFLRNNLSQNADYNEVYATPFKWGKTDSLRESPEYQALEESLRDLGTNGYAITGTGEVLQFLETNTGNGYKTYESLQKRCEQNISKIILGHADGIDSKAKSIGGGTGGSAVEDEDSTAEGRALLVTEKKQDDFALNILNEIVLPKFRKLGIPIPEGFRFAVTNDNEEFEARRKEDNANLQTATIAQAMKNAGLKMGAKYFEERTGITTTDAPEPEPSFGKLPFSEKTQNRLKKIYSAKHPR